MVARLRWRPAAAGFLGAVVLRFENRGGQRRARMQRVGSRVAESVQKLLCGNARSPESYHRLIGAEKVQMLFTDGAYGCGIQSHVSRAHREFVEGSGMSQEQVLTFYSDFLSTVKDSLQNGTIFYLCIDARSMASLLNAVSSAGLEQKELCVWDKQAGGMGSFYRNQAEFVVVAKHGRASHVNNVHLGMHWRNRTTIWSYPGLAQFRPGRVQALAMHPTVKPVGLVADAILDASLLGGVVLDPFVGSGTTLIAAQRTRRRGRAIELDPKYVDIAVQRLEKFTGQLARLAAWGEHRPHRPPVRAGVEIQTILMERGPVGDAPHSGELEG